MKGDKGLHSDAGSSSTAQAGRAATELDRVFKRKDTVVSRDIAGETLIVPIRGRLADIQCLFALNPMGAYIWQELNAARSVDLIREDILQRFAVSREQMEGDLDEFIAQLIEADLIEEVT